MEPGRWWDLHVRKARGETLSPQEQQLYDAELARLDQQAPPLKSDLDDLKKMRAQVLALVKDNAELRNRLSELEKEIYRIEAALSPETREALGVGD